MNDNDLNNNLLDAIKARLPEGNSLNMLMNTLNLGKEAIYRRLRGDVLFSFHEATLIVRKLGISINEITDIRTKNNEYLFCLRPQQFYSVNKSNYAALQAFVDSLELIAQEQTSTFVNSSNMFPPFPGHMFSEIFKLSAFRSMYEDMGFRNTDLYKEMVLPDDYIKLNRDIILGTMNIKDTSYIWKADFLKDMVNEIKYFESIELLDKEDVNLLKKDLANFIDFVDEMAINGVYKETGNRVQIYISQISFDASYYYVESPNYSLSMVGAFSFNHLTSMDKETLALMKRKIDSFRRISTLISESSEMHRARFLRDQRELIDRL